MTRGLHWLSAASIRRARPGLYADGGGLYLQVTKSKDGKSLNCSWLFRYKVNGRDRYAGLGSVNTIGLAEARELARKCRQMRLAGIDPIEQRRSERASKEAESAKAITFEECALAYVHAHSGSWKNQKHARQWPSSLQTHVFPTLGKLPVNLIDTPLVLKALKGVWESAPETGSRLRGRIESILDWATAAKYRHGDNPARWGGLLEHLLPAPRKAKPVAHLAAMPFSQVPAFMAKLRGENSVGARALEFAILSAARSGEVLGARWDEIDGDVWRIPGSRMKAGREHEVPLSARCLEILTEVKAHSRGDAVFPGRTGHNPLAGGTFRWLLAKLGNADTTAHGFRSSFRDWCGERTNFPREIAEAALAHVVGDKAEQAYRRGSALEKRRKLMDAWAAFCARPVAAGEVVPLRRSVP